MTSERASKQANEQQPNGDGDLFYLRLLLSMIPILKSAHFTQFSTQYCRLSSILILLLDDDVLHSEEQQEIREPEK